MFWSTAFPVSEKKYSGYFTFLDLSDESIDRLKKYFGMRWSSLRKKPKGKDLLVHLTYKEYVHLFEVGSLYKLPAVKEHLQIE